MEIKTDITVTVFYLDEVSGSLDQPAITLKPVKIYNFNDVNKAAAFQQNVLNAENVKSATLEMMMFKSEVQNG